LRNINNHYEFDPDSNRFLFLYLEPLGCDIC
jgi:hypothetical protein